MTETVIGVESLVKDHVSNFLRRKFRAVDGLSLNVLKSETYGLLGPNGAGKTTTQKLLLGLLKPTSGKVQVLGYEPGDPRALARIGFLPENPYFYAYLTAQEFLDFFARLFAIGKRERQDKIKELLELVSLVEAKDRPVRKFSKGMMQRLGLAQALLNDPELIFLDEPHTGLDPIGRRDVRKILESLKSQGKTIFFNSHLLPDVHDICDKVGVLHRGKMVGEGRVADIAAGNYQGLEDFFMQVITESEQKYREQGHAAHHIERGG